MASKLELMMKNNELEARVIELETKVKSLDAENDKLVKSLEDAEDAAIVLQEQYRALEQSIREEADSRPALSYDLWYAMLHEQPGSNPSLAVLEATRGTRIIA